jgi:poly [ADP-ribose] polymerase
MDSAFRAHGLKVGNVKELWHGTRIGNLLSIMKGGFVIPPSNSSHCTGRMFGNGVYFSDQSTKSLNYAMGYAPGQRGGVSYDCFMFVNDVAMGKEYIPSGPSSSLDATKLGYDSTFAMANRSGVMNNEMIVYATHQINPVYLVEFK